MCSSIVARLERPIADLARTAVVADPSLRTAAVHGWESVDTDQESVDTDQESVDTDQAYSAAGQGWEMLAGCTGSPGRVADAAR